MTRPVRIFIQSRITDCTAPLSQPEDTEQISYHCQGTLKETDKQYEVSYQEDAKSEMGDTVTTLVFPKGQSDLCMMARTGAVHCTISFSEAAPRQTCVYNTPFGPFSFTVNTKKLRCAVNDRGGRLHVEYYIELRGVSSQFNRMSILITPQQEE